MQLSGGTGTGSCMKCVYMCLLEDCMSSKLSVSLQWQEGAAAICCTSGKGIEPSSQPAPPASLGLLLTQPAADRDWLQDELLARLGMADLFAQAARGTKQIGWPGIILTVAAAALITLGLGAAIWHYRARHHAQQQIREIMCGPILCCSACCLPLARPAASWSPPGYTALHANLSWDLPLSCGG